MAEIVNLRRVRKRLAREKDARHAEENRFLHGRTKAERQQNTLEKAQLERGLDHARLEHAVPKQADDEPAPSSAQPVNRVAETGSPLDRRGVGEKGGSSGNEAREGRHEDGQSDR